MKWLAAAAIGLSVYGCQPAEAQPTRPVCGPRERIVKLLADKHKESRVSRMLNVDGSLIELFAADSGTWTLLATYPKKPTCIVAAGKGYEATPWGPVA